MGTSSSKEKSCCCVGNRGEDRFPKSSPSHDLTGRQYLLIDQVDAENQENLTPPNSTLPITAHTTSSITKTSETTLLSTNCTTNRIYSKPEQKTDENTKPAFASNGSLSLTKQALQKQQRQQRQQQHSPSVMRNASWLSSPLIFHTKSLHRLTNGGSSTSTPGPNTPDSCASSMRSASSNTSIRTCDSEVKQCIRNLTLEYSIMPTDENERINDLTNELTTQWLNHYADTDMTQACHPLMYHKDRISAIAYSSDGITICSAGKSTMHIWNSNTGETITKCTGHVGGTCAIDFSPGGSKIISGGKDCKLRLWGTLNGDLVKQFQGHIGCVNSVQFSADGTLICSGSDDESVRVWNVLTGETIRVLDAHSDAVSGVSFSPDGDQLCSCGNDGRVHLWKLSDGDECLPFMTLYNSTDGIVVSEVAWSPCFSYVIAACGEHINQWDSLTGAFMCSLLGHKGNVTSLSFSVDGSFVASSGVDGTVRIWDMTKLESSKCLSCHNLGKDEILNAVKYSPNGNRLCVGFENGTVKQWNVVEL